MQSDNPYASPAATIHAQQPAPPRNRDEVATRTTTVRQRVNAYVIDVLILLPLIGISYLASAYSRMAYLYLLVPNLLVGLFYHVYLVQRYGGTPGKRLMHMRIVALDGAAIGARQAFLRYMVLFILGTASAVVIANATRFISDAAYFSQGYFGKAQALAAVAPDWYSLVNIAMQIWIWGQLIVILCNKQRRAVHDYIAGTVVIDTDRIG